MPVTKRLPHLGSPKNLIEYILDEKNDGEKVGCTSSLNCNVETALYEFRDIQKKYKMGGTRGAYHIIQSFSPKDKITVEQANEIGLRMCKELYPTFQCIVSTHIDKGHIHNHICVNAINLEGRKLEDRLANEKEGLYGVSDTSDRISKEYGCFIMPRKTYLKSKNSQDDYYQYKRQSWKEQIEEHLEKLIPKCNSVDELLDELSILGYEIRRGKHIAVRCLGMQRYARIDTINLKYSTSNLYKLYREKDNVKLLAIKTEQNEFNSIIFQKANESKIAIEKSQLGAKGKVYSEYQKTKYQEIKRYYQLKQQLEYLDKYNIRDFDDIESQISTYGYGKNYGPFYKTNKSLCTVLMVISKTTKLFKWAHPALGTISFVCKTVSKVGDKFVKTMYIKFYQAYDTAKPSNVRETQYWYYDSNHKNLAKSRTIKFSNTRPS